MAQRSDLSQPYIDSQPKYKDKEHLWKVVLNVALAATFSGYVLAYFNTINFDDTIRIFSITYDRAVAQGFLSFIIALGAALGGYLASLMLSHYSRKQCFLIVAYVSIIATLLLQTKSILIIFLCRLIQGIAVGVSTVLRSLYIKQILPIQLAGEYGAINQLMFAVGLIFTFVQTYLLSLFLTPQSYWRIVYFVPVVFLAIQIYNFTFMFPYETPKYLLEHGKFSEAQELIKVIYKSQFVEERIYELKKIIELTQREECQGQQTEMKSKNIQQQIKPFQRKIGKSNKLALITAYHLSLLQQITGIQIVILYAGQILLDIEPSLQKIVPIILQVQGFVATFYTMKLLNKYGCVKMIQNGLKAMATIHFLISISYFWKTQQQIQETKVAIIPSFIIIIGLIIFRAIFSLTFGPILWIYLPDIVEPHTISVSTTIHWLMAAFVSFIFPVLVQIFGGPAWIFMMMAILIALGLLINQKLLVQTRGRAEWQIREQYDNKWAKF